MNKKISILTVILSLAMVLTSCGGKKDPNATPAPSTPDPELVKNTINATITLEDGDEIELELYPDLAPETVDNFVELAEDGFYDGTIFHRVIEDFMIQGGGYDEDLKEQKAGTITGEFAANGFENTLSHTRGVISMARSQKYDSATSQFFIVQEDSTYLDGQYAAFGIVTEGMDVVDDIASARTGSVTSAGMENVPVTPIVIESITIDNNSSAKSSKSTKKSSKSDDEDEDDTASSKSSKSSSKSNSKSSSLDEEDMTDEDVINSLFGSDSGSSSSSKSSSSGSSSKSSSKSSSADDDDEDSFGSSSGLSGSFGGSL